MMKPQTLSCDLLEKSYLCGINNNKEKALHSFELL